MVEAAKTKSEKEKVKDVTVQNLINWGVVKNVDGTLAPTNAFVLLTDNTFPFAKIQCALFKGTERVVFIDKRDFERPLYKQIEEAYEFVLKHINLGAEISGLVRTDAYELPTEAIREAIVNATTHRNFLDRACVQVAVYDDRVEVTSPGMLYGGLTIEQIKEGGSRIRNRCIAEVFSRMKIIESWGTGIKRMFSSCKEYGIREPELLEIGDSFRVNLYRPSYNEVHQKVHQSSPKSSPKEVNQTQQKILDMILENPEITQTTMAEKLDITPRAVKKNIKELVDKGLVEREGSARKGYGKNQASKSTKDLEASVYASNEPRACLQTFNDCRDKNSLLLSARRLCAGNIPINRCGETKSTRYGKNLPGGISRFVAGKIDYRSRDFFRQPDFL